MIITEVIISQIINITGAVDKYLRKLFIKKS